MFIIKAYAKGGGGSRGTTSNGMPSGRGMNSMSSYYRNGGRSALGATKKTRGRPAAIRPVIQ